MPLSIALFCFGLGGGLFEFRCRVSEVFEGQTSHLMTKYNINNDIEFCIKYSYSFANGPGDRSSIPRHVIPKTFKMVLDTSLLNPQQYKVRIEGKEEKSMERSSAFPYTSV